MQDIVPVIITQQVVAERLEIVNVTQGFVLATVMLPVVIVNVRARPLVLVTLANVHVMDM